MYSVPFGPLGGPGAAGGSVTTTDFVLEKLLVAVAPRRESYSTSEIRTLTKTRFSPIVTSPRHTGRHGRNAGPA